MCVCVCVGGGGGGGGWGGVERGRRAIENDSESQASTL